MFLCQNDEYQPTTERQPKRNVYFLSLTRLRVQLAQGGGDEGMGEKGRIELRTRLF